MNWKTIGVGACRVCGRGRSLLKSHICPDCRKAESEGPQVKSSAFDHYVRHVLRPGDYVKTEFECRASFGARCRLACDQLECREQCICESEYDRGADLQDQGECLIVAWLKNDAPEECYNGEEVPVRGPDWQPIIPEWNGDTWDWDYAK